MKKLITTCALFAAATMVSFAQSKATSKTTAPSNNTAATRTTGATPEQIADRYSKTMQAQLGLNAAETKGVYEAELSLQKDLKQAKETGFEPGPGQTMQMKMTKDQRIQSVLTAEHFAKYQAMQSK
jgi:hypothetical protein